MCVAEVFEGVLVSECEACFGVGVGSASVGKSGACMRRRVGAVCEVWMRVQAW